MGQASGCLKLEIYFCNSEVTDSSPSVRRETTHGQKKMIIISKPDGKSHRYIADMFGVSQSFVSNFFFKDLVGGRPTRSDVRGDRKKKYKMHEK